MKASDQALTGNDLAPLVAAAVLVLLSFLLLPTALVKLQFSAALLVTTGFALAAWALRGVTASGALAGWAVAFVLYLGGGRRLFLVLFAVFLLTLAATFAGRKRKASLGLAEDRRGRRAAQVLANLGVAAGCVLLARFFGPVVLVCAVATLAEAAADTVSSETGQAYGSRTVLITSLREVRSGTNGGITWLGSLAGAASSFGISAIALFSHLVTSRQAAAAAVAGTAGMFIDSFLGALLENRGKLNNQAVNLISTASAVLILLPFLLMSQ